MAAQANKRKSKSELLAEVEAMAFSEDGGATAKLKAIEFLLEHGDQGEGNVDEIWDELFLVGNSEE